MIPIEHKILRGDFSTGSKKKPNWSLMDEISKLFNSEYLSPFNSCSESPIR